MSSVSVEHEEVYGEDVGVMARVTEEISVLEFPEIGEELAKKTLENGNRNRVWVWLYGKDMDMDGPAICVSYIDDTADDPITQFEDPQKLMSWYMMAAIEQIDELPKA